MAVAVAGGYGGLLQRSEYPYGMNSLGNDVGGSGEAHSPRSSFNDVGGSGEAHSPRSSFNADNDANQWLYPDKTFDIATWPMNQEANSSSELQNTFANSMGDLHNTMNSKANESRAVNTNDTPQSHQHIPYQWQQQTSSMPLLDVQWQEAKDQGKPFDINIAYLNSSQQTYSSSINSNATLVQFRQSSTPHTTFSAPNLGYSTSNLWQRRLTVKQAALEKLAPGKSTTLDGKKSNFFDAHSDALQYSLPSNRSSNSCTPLELGNSASVQADDHAWSVDPSLCSSRQSYWNQNVASPQGFNPLLLQQPQHWMQRDRVHSRQSSQDMGSPQTSTSNEVSHPPSLISSSVMSLASPPCPNYDISPQIKMERRYEDDEDDSDQDSHIAKHRRMDKGSTNDDHKMGSSCATLSAATAATSTSSVSRTKRSISKVVVNKSGTIDKVAHCTDDGDGRETRHLCPHPGCDKHFSTSGHARRHSRIHASLRPFECPHLDCDATFTRRDNCSQHQKSRHRSQLLAHRLSKDH